MAGGRCPEWLIAGFRVTGTVDRGLTMKRDFDRVELMRNVCGNRGGLTSVPVLTSRWWSAMAWLRLVPAKDDDVIHGFSSCALNASLHKLHQEWHILARTRSFSAWLLLTMMRSHTLSCILPSKVSGLVCPPWLTARRVVLLVCFLFSTILDHTLNFPLHSAPPVVQQSGLLRKL